MSNRNELRVNPIQIWNDNLDISRLKDGGVRIAVGFGGMKTDEWLNGEEVALARITLGATHGDIKATRSDGTVEVAKAADGSGTITLIRPKYRITANLSDADVTTIVKVLTEWSQEGL